MSTGELKGILIELLQRMVAAHQEARAHVTEQQIDEYMAVRQLEVPLPPAAAAAAAAATAETPAAK
jgi:hypothetical protein